MYEDVDLTKPHEIEGMRRSIAMLSKGQPALDRDQAERVLAALLRHVTKTT